MFSIEFQTFTPLILLNNVGSRPGVPSRVAPTVRFCAIFKQLSYQHLFSISMFTGGDVKMWRCRNRGSRDAARKSPHLNKNQSFSTETQKLK